MGGLDAFRPIDSRVRAEKLYGVLKPHLRDGLSYLDIGCGYGILAPHVKRDFPNSTYLGFDADAGAVSFCKTRYPWARWERGAIIPAVHYSRLWLLQDGRAILYQDLNGERVPTASELAGRKYNVILHLANDAWWANDLWKIHIWLTRRALEKPTLVLLESGWRENYDGPVVTMREIRGRYLGVGLKVLAEGDFEFKCPNYNKNKRFYCLLGKDVE